MKMHVDPRTHQVVQLPRGGPQPASDVQPGEAAAEDKDEPRQGRALGARGPHHPAGQMFVLACMTLANGVPSSRCRHGRRGVQMPQVPGRQGSAAGLVGLADEEVCRCSMFPVITASRGLRARLGFIGIRCYYDSNNKTCNVDRRRCMLDLMMLNSKHACCTFAVPARTASTPLHIGFRQWCKLPSVAAQQATQGSCRDYFRHLICPSGAHQHRQTGAFALRLPPTAGPPTILQLMTFRQADEQTYSYRAAFRNCRSLSREQEPTPKRQPRAGSQP